MKESYLIISPCYWDSKEKTLPTGNLVIIVINEMETIYENKVHYNDLKYYVKDLQEKLGCHNNYNLD